MTRVSLSSLCCASNLCIVFPSPSLAEAPVAGAAVLIQGLVSNLLSLILLWRLGLAVDVPAALLCPFRVL